MRTKYCIGCGAPANCWSGHIHTDIGTITTGWCSGNDWCSKGMKSPRPISGHCTSINPNACSGDFKLSEITLVEELNAENLAAHARSQEFSRMIDAEISGSRNYDFKEQNYTPTISLSFLLFCVFFTLFVLLSLILITHNS